MRDLFSLQHSIFEDVKKDDAAGMEQEFIKELFNDLCLEIEKGTDLSKYLTVSFNKKEEYVIQLKLPISSGIFNVNERIQLYYGIEYGLSYESEAGKWTKAILRIPKQEEGYRV